MRVFIYEHFTAQGAGREPDSPDHALFREGRAMRDAVAADFRNIAGVDGFTFPDDGEPVDSYTFSDAANAADWTLVIAPEGEHVLLNWADEVWPTHSRLLGPSSDAIRLTSDKLRLAEHWYDHDVRTPATHDREPALREAFPVVWKPIDGAGSVATFQLNSAKDVARTKVLREAERHTGPMIVQEFVGGKPVSVAFLCGPAGNLPLAPVYQLLSDDGRFKYLGGELPIPKELADRAVTIAQRAVDCVPGLLGYVGVDLVLGDAADGSRDHAIEINPRLTTSYVGLRALGDFNIAEAMLRAANGLLPGPLNWREGRVRFDPEGRVEKQ